MQISGILTSHVKIDVSPYEAINQLFLYYFNNKYEDLVRKDDGIYLEYDESIHGSPAWKLRFITNDDDLIKIYDGLSLAYKGMIAKKV